ncbi:MAG TPA: PTS sugar transporter subunit IIA [Polyangia bacterium]|nr:PTS sugar transporter subunit IIA [Polyangia bacterium]
MRVVDFLQPEAVVANLGATTKPAVLAELSERMARVVPGVDASTLRRILEERELLASTAIGDGIAIPHGKLDSVGHLVGVLGRAVNGIEFESIDGKPTHLVFMLVAPASSTGVHLKALARLSRLFRDPDFRQRLLAAPDSEAMYRVIAEEDAKY